MVELREIELLDNQFIDSFRSEISNQVEHLYSLSDYRALFLEYFKQSSTTDTTTTEDKYVAELDKYFKIKLKLYLPRVTSILDKINSIEHIEQKSQKWLDERKSVIAASESGYLLGFRATSSILNYIKGKINISTSLDKLKYMESIQHGNICEDISKMIYCSRNRVKLAEYGLIKTTKKNFLGASPDGIVTEDSTNTRIGRLVEIKNPYDYDDSDLIKPEYKVQILQQQYVLDLPVCDFVKTNIIRPNCKDSTVKLGFKPIETLRQFLADIPSSDPDTPIANANIPRNNLNSKGMEKGVIITYKGEVKIYPLDKPYTEQAILLWINETKTALMEQGFSKQHIYVEYWYLANYFEKTLVYENDVFENNYLVRLELIWKLIEQLKLMQNKHNQSTLDSFINNKLKPLITNTSAYYQNINNFDEQVQTLVKCITLASETANKPIEQPTIDDTIPITTITSDSNTNTKQKKTSKSDKSTTSSKLPDKKVFKLNPHAKITVELDF